MDILDNTHDNRDIWDTVETKHIKVDVTHIPIAASEPIELFDWILNENRVRGSIKGRGGFWLCGSKTCDDILSYYEADPDFEKPIRFNQKTRIIELKNGAKYIINKDTICKALGLNKQSEKILKMIPN